jgi:type IV secretory pathway VirB10-like protein
MQRNLINGLLLAMIIGTGFVALPAAAQTYKWTDADGKVHYSDQPPPANAKEQATIKPPKPSAPIAATVPTDKGAPAAKAKTYVEQEADFKKRQVEAAESEAAEKKKAAEAEQNKQNCEQARLQLKSLQSGGRQTRTNAQGEREYLNDAQIAQDIERAKKIVDNWCK